MKLKERGVVILPGEFDDNWIKKLTSTDLNLLGIHPVGNEEFKADGVTPGMMLEKFLTDENRKKIDFLEEKGISVEIEMHSLSTFLPRNLFSSNPEFFRMNSEGVRTADYNMCFASDAALEIISENAARFAKLFKPRNNRYNLWLDDVAVGSCNCEKCRETKVADHALKVCKAILRGLRRVNSSAEECYLAYHDTIALPEYEKTEEGIFLEYAPIRRDFTVPLGEPSCEKNAAEIKELPSLLDFFGRKGAKALEYWIDNSLYSGYKKPPKPLTVNTELIKNDCEFYKKLGFESATSFACYLGADYTEQNGSFEGLGEYAASLA